MAVPRLRVPSTPPRQQAPAPGRRAGLRRGRALPPHLHDAAALLGETLLRVLEPSHRSMNSSLHALAGSDELDLGAFLYAIAAAAAAVWRRPRDRHGPGGRGLRARTASGRSRSWTPLEAPARRRRWFDDGQRHAGRAARLDLGPRRPDPDARRLPDRVEQAARGCARPMAAGRRRARARGARRGARRRGGRLACSSPRPGARRSGARSRDGRRPAAEPAHPHARRLAVGYARMTRRWWAPVRATLDEHALDDRPMYFVSSNPHSIVNLVTGTRARREDEIVLGRARRARRPARGARGVRATAAPRARGRTSSTSPRGLLRGAADGDRASGAARRSARSASRTSPRARRCACRRR